jgi:hypothetical protein
MNYRLGGRRAMTNRLASISSITMTVSSTLDRIPTFFFFNVVFSVETTQLEDPRQEWKSMQEDMLREYLNSAQDTLEAKREIYDIKQQRLLLAQDEYNHLNALAASRTSCEYFK